MGRSEPVTQSSFMFLVLCNEAFGYTHERTLDSDLALVMSMLREHGYLVNDRNKSLLVDDDESGDNHGEWVEVIDFDTGKKKRVRRMNPV
ncbi:hypothetical protein [Parabacteroides distasonis]|uniref:Uncharacterized protein n=1 Tax=Parabacteroides distasonis TaxID=823 RepID=A0A174W0M5_PARDI|nr:hypothetical protein [Parabacteroides distasonis]MRY85017.1 hypothetical protein [Parabacteroides distasonis]MRZ06815.1 hypothetical protein [Parabacteroides distasonis]CUQ38018.1 Uncharacterised protein [Parabacteroides distasonis]